MADLQQVLEALRNAEASGNTADAQQLAQLAQKLQTQQPQPDPNAPDTSLLTGIKAAGLRIGAGLADAIPTVNKALTGYENPRLFLDTGGDGFQLSDLKTLRMMDEKDLPSNAKNPFGFSGTEFEDAASFLKTKKKELNYQPKVPWDQVKADPSAANVLGFMGETAITSLPDMAAAMISAPAYFASYVAPIAQERAKNDGGRAVTPEDLAFAAVASAGIASAERFGAKGIFGDVAGNVAQRVTGAGIREGTTEAIQEPLEYAGGTVGTQTGFDPLEAADRAAAGFVGGSGAGSGLRTVTEVATGGSQQAPDDQQAATSLANRMDMIARENGFNPKNVSNRSDGKGARGLQDDTHSDLSDDLQESFDNLGKAIKKDKNDNAETLRLKRLAKTALKKAKTKVKNTVGNREFSAINKLVGGTVEGERLMNLMRESNELTNLINKNLKGGVSRFTDLLAPLSSASGYNARQLVEVPTRAALTGTAAINTSGLSLIPQFGLYAGGRLLDAATGNRSTVARFIKQNRGTDGLKNTGSGAAVSETDQQKEANKKRFVELNNMAFEADTPIRGNPLNPKPQMIIAEAVGTTSPKQIFNIAEEMKKDKRYSQINEELNQVQNSVKNGGRINQVNLIGSIMADYVGNKASADTRVSPILRKAQIQQGLEDNQKRIEMLRDAAKSDTTLGEFDLDIVNKALDQLKLDLGRNPIEAAETIVKNAEAVARDYQRVGAYLRPYLGRIKQQQKGRKRKANN